MGTSNVKGWTSLCSCTATIAIVWIIVLPWIGSQQSVKSDIEYLKQRGIDPSALYYTDLEALVEIESDINTMSKAHPDALWSIPSAQKK